MGHEQVLSVHVIEHVKSVERNGVSVGGSEIKSMLRQILINFNERFDEMEKKLEGNKNSFKNNTIKQIWGHFWTDNVVIDEEQETEKLKTDTEPLLSRSKEITETILLDKREN